MPSPRQQPESNSSKDITKQMKETRDLYLQGKEAYEDEKYEQATEYFRIVAERQEALLGKYHKETVKTYWRLGKGCCKASKPNDALEAFQRSIRMASTSLGEATTKLLKEDIEECWKESFPDRDTALEVMYSIFDAETEGDGQCKKRNFRGAIELYSQALEIQSALMGGDSLDAADIRMKLGICCLRVSALTDAEQALQASHACYIRKVGQDHPATYSANASMRKLTTLSGRNLDSRRRRSTTTSGSSSPSSSGGNNRGGGMMTMKGWISASLSSLGSRGSGDRNNNSHGNNRRSNPAPISARS